MFALTENEVIIRTIRKHWFYPLLHSLNAAFLFLIPTSLVLFLLGKKITYQEITITLTFGKPSFLVFGIALWGLILWLRYFSFWTDHHLDGWILTNKRVIDVEQRGFFRREVASFRLERLQDVTTEVKGIIATFLDFGDVHVQTAGADKEFILRMAPKPKEIKAVIMEQYSNLLEQTPVERDIDGVASVKN